MNYTQLTGTKLIIVRMLSEIRCRLATITIHCCFKTKGRIGASRQHLCLTGTKKGQLETTQLRYQHLQLDLRLPCLSRLIVSLGRDSRLQSSAQSFTSTPSTVVSSLGQQCWQLTQGRSPAEKGQLDNFMQLSLSPSALVL